MKITSFDRQNLKILRQTIDKALSQIATEYGIRELKIHNIRFDSNRFRTRLEGKLSITPPIFSGQIKNLIGTKITWLGSEYEIIDYKPNRHKYPLIVKHIITQKRYKAPMEAYSKHVIDSK